METVIYYVGYVVGILTIAILVAVFFAIKSIVKNEKVRLRTEAKRLEQMQEALKLCEFDLMLTPKDEYHYTRLTNKPFEIYIVINRHGYCCMFNGMVVHYDILQLMGRLFLEFNSNIDFDKLDKFKITTF